MKTANNILLYFTVVLLLTGCSVIDGQTSEEVKPLPVIMKDQVSQPQESISKLEKHLSEWQELKPGVKRLVAIEAELVQLIDQLNQMVNDNSEAVEVSDNSETLEVNNNKKPPSMAKEVEINRPAAIVPNKTKLEKSQPEKNSSIVPETATYALQLASVSNKDSLTQAWLKIKPKAPQLFYNLKPSYEQVNVKGKIYFRLKIGSFGTLAKANKFCDQLMLQGVKCFSTAFGGKNL